MKDDTGFWGRKCKTEGCNRLARYNSDYCNDCIEIWNMGSKKTGKPHKIL